MKLLLFLPFAATALMLGQVRPTASYPDSGPNLPAQRIGADDLLSISVYDSPEFTRTVRVSSDGNVRLPMLKRRITAQDLLPSDLELVIANALAEEEILVDPVVTVTIAEYHSRPISVAGAVRSPVTFQAVGHMTLLEAITKAGGVDKDAGPDLIITRRDARSVDVPISRRIPLKSLLEGSDPGLNIDLTGGEEIRIPEAGKIFVVGNVKKPGVFPLQDGADATVLQLLALAEGLAPYAAKTAYIFRVQTDGGDADRTRQNSGAQV